MGKREGGRERGEGGRRGREGGKDRENNAVMEQIDLVPMQALLTKGKGLGFYL